MDENGVTIKHFDEINKVGQWIIVSAGMSFVNEILASKYEDGLHIQLTINDVPYDFEELANRIQQAYDADLKKQTPEVAEILATPKGRIYHRLRQIRREVKKLLYEIDCASDKVSERPGEGGYYED